MQEGLHDDGLAAARNPKATVARCEAQVRYLLRYSPLVETHIGASFRSELDRQAAMQAVAAEAGDCPPAPWPTNGTHRASGHSRDVRGDTMPARWVDYVSSIVAGLRSAKSLDDARKMIDAHVVVASADDSLPAAELYVVAAAAALTTSSAIEWDTFFQPREASIFLWGWLSAVGEFIVDVVVHDVVGCIGGMGARVAGMLAEGWEGDSDQFIDEMTGACVEGGIAGSLAAFAL
jgi:hypothetical protein